MKLVRLFSTLTLWACLLGAPTVRAQDIVITELMASNLSTLQDLDGDYSDWLELYNAGVTAANLGGWYLTDDPLDPTRWRLPAVTLAADAFLVVFASGKDIATVGVQLHANFKLQSEAGGYLALVKPDGATVAWEYNGYPAQIDDFSYGLEQSADSAVLVAAGAAAKSLVPTSGALGVTWTERTFNDTTWTSGTTGVGYDRNPDYGPYIGIDVGAAMDNQRASSYLRVPFTVSAGVSFTSLRLRMQYDDGYLAYLNGDLIAQKNAPASPAWDSGATTGHDDAVAVIFEDVDLPSSASLLVTGTNVLAIHGLNNGANSSDYLIVPELLAFDSGTLNRNVKQYFHLPTPGSGNSPGFPGISGNVMFSRTSAVFNGSLSVTLTKDTPSGVIRYTTNGSEPTATSTLYTAPITLNASTYLRARVIEPGLAPGPVASETFLAVANDLINFTSNVPVVLLENFGGGGIPGSGYQPIFMAIFEPGANGRTNFRELPSLATRGGFRTRGSSTGGQPKPNLALETWDEHNADKDYPVLGMPADSDWVLHAPYNFDPAMLRNPLIYDLSNQAGTYATRDRFVEVYINTGGGSMAQADYFGVYSFLEKIKRGDDRVKVERLVASYTTEPLIAGGYMAKIDRLDPGDSGFSAGGQTLGLVYPKEEDIIPVQRSWIQNYVSTFITVLNGANYRDPVAGYVAYMDPDLWVDHHIFNVLAKNVDALRLSTYMYKSRDGRLVMGPIWDFDRSMNSTDGRDDATNTWNGTGDGTPFFTYPWWGRLFQDLDFWQRWRDRWHALRQTTLSTANVNATIDGMADEIREAQARNFARWTGLLTRGTWQTEVNLLKTWLSQRSTWIDSQFVKAPTLALPEGEINAGSTLTITAPAGSIWYTLDGSDPRAPGGTPAAGATLYSAQIRLNSNARVVARATTSAAQWSGPSAATYVVETPRLVITELMYHPSDPAIGSGLDADDFEFLELLNADDEPIVLAGARVTGGVSFTFPASDTSPLFPGEYVLLVKNLAAFATRYDTVGLRIAGEYAGNLSNNPESIGVDGPLLEPILLFTYSDAWYPETDGQGSSLVIVDPQAPVASWDLQESWQPSAIFGGTPGQGESGTPPGGRQLPGDSNQDGSFDIADVVSLLLRLFGGGGPATPPCEGATIDEGANVILLSINGDAQVNLTDVVYALNYLFKSGPSPTLGRNCVRITGCPTACGF